jgi:molybdopterin synthase sulfur carrier subunit
MSMMQLRFFATFRPIVGGATAALEAPPGVTVRELIARVVQRWPALGPQLLDAQGRLYGHVHVLVNGRDAPYLPAGLDTPLGPEDVVSFFPAVAGGTHSVPLKRTASPFAGGAG